MDRRNLINNKKGSMVTPLVVVGFILLMILLFVLIYSESLKLGDRKIGHNQFRLFDLYQEGEQARYYMEKSAPFALGNALSLLAANGGFWNPQFESLTSTECGRFGGYNVFVKEDITCLPNQAEANYRITGIFQKEFGAYLQSYSPKFLSPSNFQLLFSQESNGLAVTGFATRDVAFRDGIKKIYQPGSEDFYQFLSGFQYPISGFPKNDPGCLPSSSSVMPNAPREYRNGVHEGIDFYSGLDFPGTYRSSECDSVDIDAGTPLIAVKDGVISRIDHDYEDLTAEKWAEIEQTSRELGNTRPDHLDILRGRQVYIDHGNGIVSRYAHMGEVPSSLNVRDTVKQGDVIGLVGDSGTPESITNPGVEDHLHFELRGGDSFVGAGMSPVEVRALYENIFSAVGRS